MKCTIEVVRTIALKDKRIGARVEGFIPMPDTSIIPYCVRKWMSNYSGVKTIVYDNGIFVAAWADTVCNEKDNYNETTGRHIAESKSKAKIYRFMRNFAGYMSDYFDSMSNQFQDVYLKYDHCVDHEDTHIECLGNENND